MAGHSKWASIKHKKKATDAKRGALFTKLARAIIVAAREGGGDPANNLALQNAIEKARAASMPKDNIERAIARGTGAGADAAAFEHITYEGYGPGGVAVYVEALSDNRNRTASDVRGRRPERRARRDRGRGLHGRVGGADDGAEVDGVDPGRGSGAEAPAPDGRTRRQRRRPGR